MNQSGSNKKTILINGKKVELFIRFSNLAKFIQVKLTASKSLELILPNHSTLQEGLFFLELQKEKIASRLESLARAKSSSSPVHEGSNKLDIGGKTIEYFVRRSNRAKYIQMRMNLSHRIELILPERASFSDGLNFLQNHLDWVESHSGTQSQKKIYRYFFLGEELKLNKTFVKLKSKATANIKDGQFNLVVPEGIILDEIRCFEVFLKSHAKNFLPHTLFAIAEKYGFSPKRCIVRDQTTRWGSCSNKGTISLNYNLTKMRHEVIEYVIVHELCHLRQMNHSHKFWREVEKILPNWRELRRELKTWDVMKK